MDYYIFLKKTHIHTHKLANYYQSSINNIEVVGTTNTSVHYFGVLWQNLKGVKSKINRVKMHE